MSMRIAGGQFRGIEIAAPAGQATRPTSDRVREALFNILLHGIDGFAIEGARVLDLFAGTGALGLEALSRGAAFALFIDDAVAARGAIRENIEKMRVTGATKLFKRDATDLGEAGNLTPFDLVFADPPYGNGLGEQALASAVIGGWLAPNAVVILEERAGIEVPPIPGLEQIDSRDYGDTTIRFYRRL